MNPASTAWAQTPARRQRFAFIGFPHGAIMDKWSPAGTGANYEMSPILQPLEPFRKHMTIVSGCATSRRDAGAASATSR